jgi:ComF family protein
MPGAPRNKGIKMYSTSRKVLQSLPSACPLCGLGARGGDLCAGCAHDLSSLLNERVRCQRCFEALATPALTAEIAEIAEIPQMPEIPEAHVFAPVVQCWRCERYPPAYSRLVAAVDYAYPWDMLIQRYKEGARLAYSGLFARLLWERVQARTGSCQGKLLLGALVPIPSSQSALKRRGFNPAGELARELARLSGRPLQLEWLARTRETTTQKTLNARARRQSVSGLYTCPNAVPRVWMGVVDDVVTTGSTMDTAAQALLNAGAAGVIGLAAAHTPRAWQNDVYD